MVAPMATVPVVVHENDVRCPVCGAMIARCTGDLWEILSRNHGVIHATGGTIAGECQRCAQAGRKTPFMFRLTQNAKV